MACGCQTACGCTILGGDGITVTVLGNNIVVSATPMIGVPTFIQEDPPVYADGPYVWHQIDGGGALITTWIESGI